VALKARDCGLPLAFQVLEAPMLDDRQHTASSRRDGLPIWDRVVNEFAWRCYLGPLYGTDEVPELAAPARATDLGGLPPTFVVVGSIDGFHDEAVMYATRLNRAGVASELHIYPGAPHGYQLFETSAVAQQSSRDVLAWLRRQLPPPPAVR
jgi:acetyl esterase/lipase